MSSKALGGGFGNVVVPEVLSQTESLLEVK